MFIQNAALVLKNFPSRSAASAVTGFSSGAMRDPSARRVQSRRDRMGRQLERNEKFFAQDFAGMNRRKFPLPSANSFSSATGGRPETTEVTRRPLASQDGTMHSRRATGRSVPKRNRPTCCQPLPPKIFTLPKFGFVVCVGHPAHQRGGRTSFRARAGSCGGRGRR